MSLLTNQSIVLQYKTARLVHPCSLGLFSFPNSTPNLVKVKPHVKFQNPCKTASLRKRKERERERKNTMFKGCAHNPHGPKIMISVLVLCVCMCVCVWDIHSALPLSLIKMKFSSLKECNPYTTFYRLYLI
jgi:hypothetical protein